MPNPLDHRLLRSITGYVKDPQVGLWRKLVGVAGVAYVVWPLDAIPDVIPLLGWLDDLGVLSLAAWFVVREVRRHAKRARTLTPPGGSERTPLR